MNQQVGVWNAKKIRPLHILSEITLDPLVQIMWYETSSHS